MKKLRKAVVPSVTENKTDAVKTPVSDHRESEGLVQDRLKESTRDLIQEEVWTHLPLERKLITYMLCASTCFHKNFVVHPE